MAWSWYLEALRKYADFNGRARRREYWSFVLINFLIILGGIFLTSTLGFGDNLLGLYLLAMIIPFIAVRVRRLHDTNKSGWWLLLHFIPFGNVILLIFIRKLGRNPVVHDGFTLIGELL